MRNKGNIALLQIAIQRISELWPQARLEVISFSPHIVKLYCPNVYAVSPDGYNWSLSTKLKDRFMRYLPNPLLRLLFEVREAIWRIWPSSLRIFRFSSRHSPTGDLLEHHQEKEIEGMSEISINNSTDTSLLKGVDLFVATGAQYMSDACKRDALRTLDRLEASHKLGLPTAMVGQGIGPIYDLELVSRCTAVLPIVDLIFVRDAQVSPKLLNSFGVDSSHIIFTGDDAIQMAYQERKETYGKNIGVSIRIAQYTEVNNRHIEDIKTVLDQALTKNKTSLIALPISQSSHETDEKIIQQLFMDDKGTSFRFDRFETPIEIIHKVSHCRVVVSGTFHAAVFALAQGIPVIGLVKSEMYSDKFNGLVDQFGDGCKIIYLDDEKFQGKLAELLDIMWNSVEELRPKLLEASERHIKLGKTAYQRIHGLLAS